MGYLLMGETWPKRDPMTNREICHACWNVKHGQCGEMFNADGQIMCDHFSARGVKKSLTCGCKHECDCVHLSEQTWADQEKAKERDNRRAKRESAREALKTSPLQAVNPKFNHVPMI